MSVKSGLAVVGCFVAGLGAGEAIGELSTMNTPEHSAQAQTCAVNWPNVVKAGGTIAVAGCEPLADQYGELDKRGSKQEFLDANTDTPAEVAAEKRFDRLIGGIGGGLTFVIGSVLFRSGDRRRRELIAKNKSAYYELA